MRARALCISMSLAAVAALALAGCGGIASGRENSQAGPAAATTAGGQPSQPGSAKIPNVTLPMQLPGLGPHTLAQIPRNTRQALVVSGQGRNSSHSTAVLYQRAAGAGWQSGAVWPARNALHGWTDDHYAGDLRSPTGVFTLTDAGGRLPDPGTKLPYDRSNGFAISGTGFDGESLAGSFDYVVAINYNRQPGRSPRDWTRPLGASRGGGIWLHVDHGGPTRGCIGLSPAHLKELLRALDPAAHPVIAMGDAAFLER